MAKTLSLQKSLTGLLTLVFTFVVVAPGGLLLNAPRASAGIIMTFTVTNLADAGVGSLRQAILDANGNLNAGGNDIINTTTNGTLTLASDLPAITEGVTIDFSNQNPAFIVAGVPGLTNGLLISGGDGTQVIGITIQQFTNCIKITNPATNTTIGGNAGSVVVSSCPGAGIYNNGASGTIIKNTYAGYNGANGIGVKIDNSSSNTQVGVSGGPRNVIQSNTSDGINILNSANTTVVNNWIGLDKNGAAAANGGKGILEQTGCTGTVIGGVTAGARNVISGNTQQGIDLNSDGGQVLGNYIGTNTTGTAAIANGNAGVKVEASNVIIGGNDSTYRNVISGNTGAGIAIDATARVINTVTIRSNLLGVDAVNGNIAIPNAAGINIANGTISNVTIGGSLGGNTISGNSGAGISHQTATGTNIGANYIGLGLDGYTPVGNAGGGINIQSGTATIGSIACGTCVNIIDANGTFGLNLNSNSNTVVNNLFGYNKDAQLVANLVNTGGPTLFIQGTAASNTIGGTAAGAGNKINVATTQYGIVSNGGNSNTFRGNQFSNPLVAGAQGYAQRQGVSNENIALPVLSSVLRTSPSNVAVSGTGLATSTVDIYIDGVLISSVVVDGTGAFTTNVTNTGGTSISAFATTAGGSTSGSVAVTTIPIDVTASPIPTINYDAQGTAGSTVSIRGLGATNGDTVYSNGATTGIVVAADGTFAYPAPLVQGTNTFSITIVDGMSNTSGAVVATITGIVAGGSGTSVSAGSTGNGGSSSSSTSTTPTEPTTPTTPTEPPIDTTNTDQTPTSMAGDTEVTTPTTPTTTVEPTTSVTPTNTTNTKPTTTTKPKSYYSGIYQYVEPIKPVSIRDTMPETPATEPAFDNTLLQSDPFKGETIDGISKTFIELKLGISNPTEADLTTDNDADGLTNKEEIIAGSNPNSKDGDGDGISDFQEIEFGGTDALLADSDGDHISDNKDSEPLIYNDFTKNGTAKMFTDYIQSQTEAGNTITEPLGVTDTDKDGLNDEMELDIGTDPLVADTDGDGLSDGDEILFYQADPSNPTAEGTGGLLRINTSKRSVAAQGEQLFMGSADAGSTVGIYKVNGDGSWSILGQSEADESGRYTVYTTPLDSGRYTVVAIQGTEDNIEDITGTFTLNVIDLVKRPVYVSLANGARITERQPIVEVQAEKHTMVTFIFRSTIYGSVVLADFDGQTVNSSPREDLELGDHTVTWYAQDLSTNKKSNPTQVAFNITNEAFVSGQTGSSDTSPWTLILGSIAVLASLSALGLYFRRKSSPSRQ